MPPGSVKDLEKITIANEAVEVGGFAYQIKNVHRFGTAVFAAYS